MNKELLIQYLPSHLVEIASKFTIPETFLKEQTDLIVLILESKSINDEKEKQSWFDLYPLMNKEQIDKLREILTREKEKLAEIEKKYQEKQEEIKKKYEKAFSSPVYQQHQATIKAAEQATKQKEEQEAEYLLDQI
jgi:D-alanyl-D-alanine carboxypeptidase